MAFKSTHTPYSHMGLGRSQAAGHTLPKTYPLTVMYSVYTDSLPGAGNYATFFAMGPDAFTGTDYYTSAIVDNGTANQLSVGADGTDNSGVGAAPTGRWTRHALLCYRGADGNTHHDFYYDLPDLTKVRASQVTGTSYFSSFPTTSFMRFLDVEWAVDETLAGRLAGAKIWQAQLPVSALGIECLSPYPVLDQYRASIWGNWRLGSLEDRLDLSGNGRHLYLSGDPPTSIEGPKFQGVTLHNPIFYPELLPNAAAAVGASGNYWPFGVF